MKKEKIIKTSLIILFSFFLLIATTYFINENLVFSQQNNYKDPESVNQEDADLHEVEIKHQAANFSNLDIDIFGIKKIYPTKKNSFEWFMNNYDPESDPYLHNYEYCKE